MKLVKIEMNGTPCWAAERDGRYLALQGTLDGWLMGGAVPEVTPEEVRGPQLAPIDSQEVWASGVTYRRSREARKVESRGADVYDRVYDAQRPELFFKATASRTAAPGTPVGIRRDSRWNVPEPELALILNARGEIVAFTIGNDMSSRDIEGENPLYLPQAKVYDRCLALGPHLVTTDEVPDVTRLTIRMSIERAGQDVFTGETSTGQLNRSIEELASYLWRSQRFAHGAVLLTGTGIVPPEAFTLAAGDVVGIEIEHIGVLQNPVMEV